MPAPYGEMTPREFQARREAGTAPRLIDVRERHEYNYARIEGAELKPMGQLVQWARELDPDEEYVFQCHTGARSGTVCMLLKRAGFSHVHNLVGGIDRWSVEVDPTVPRY
jgi:sulfur-carrier protein adenylyltransferase/sulfurtransferase